MAYTSPFYIFPSIDIDSIANVSYQKLKRKLLAEFELNNNQPLEINGESLGKSEALRILESLKGESVLEQHISIFKNKELLSFLEHGDTRYLTNTENYSKKVLQIIQTEFVDRYSKLIVECYTKVDVASLKPLFNFPIQDIIEDDEAIRCYEGYVRKVKLDLIELEDFHENPPTNKKEYLNHLNNLLPHYKRKKAFCLNILPLEYHYLINDIGRNALNISVEVFNNKKRKTEALHLLRFVQDLKIEPSLLKLAKENFDIISAETTFRSTGSSSSSSIPWRAILWGIFIFVKVVFFANKCSDNSSIDSSSVESINYLPSKSQTDQRTKSLINAIVVTQEFQTENKKLLNTGSKFERPTSGSIIYSYNTLTVFDSTTTISIQNQLNQDALVWIFKNGKENSFNKWVYIRKGETSNTSAPKQASLFTFYGDQWTKSDKLFNVIQQSRWKNEAGTDLSNTGYFTKSINKLGFSNQMLVNDLTSDFVLKK